jgi:hypothetical protein
MYALRHAGLSYPVIGREMGGRDHTTVMHGVAKMERFMTSVPLGNPMRLAIIDLVEQLAEDNLEPVIGKVVELVSKHSRATNRIRKAIERGGPDAMALISALSIETSPGGVLYDGETGGIKPRLAYALGHMLARNPEQWESVITNAAPIKVRPTPQAVSQPQS